MHAPSPPVLLQKNDFPPPFSLDKEENTHGQSFERRAY